MRELFVYYRVRAADAVELATRAAAMQARLRADHPGLLARLLRRPEVQADGHHTWMEVYAADPASAPHGVSANWQTAIDAEATVLQPLLQGPRHIEVFIAVAA